MDGLLDGCVHTRTKHQVNLVLKELVKSILVDAAEERAELQEKVNKINQKLKDLEGFVKDITDTDVLETVRSMKQDLLERQSKMDSEMFGLTSKAAECAMFLANIDDDIEEEEEACDCETEFPYL